MKGAGTRYYTVRSMQAFRSQSSRSQVIILGSESRTDVEIRWPSGAARRLEVQAGDRMTVVEP